MTEPSTRRATDRAASGIHEHIERLKATEELLAGLLPTGGQAGTDGAITDTMTSTGDVIAKSPRAGRRRRWSRRAA